MSRIAFVAAIVALGLAGCDCSIDKRDTPAGTVVDVSFEPEHREGVKPSHDVPDRWWLNVCENGEKGACRTVKITHSPWSWQTKGSAVTMEWIHMKCRGWILVSIKNPMDARQLEDTWK